MKKTLSLLALATTLTAFSAFADDSNGGMVLVTNNNYQAVQVTIYDGDSVKDQSCLLPNMASAFNDYQSSRDYQIKAEVKQGWDCNSRTEKEMYQNFGVKENTTQLNINDRFIEIRY